jgi:bifunctional non-homologous end joining protein LigD
MNINQYIASKKSEIKQPTLIKSDIRERWNTRVIPRFLHTQGRAGARQYLNDYGKGISAPKIIALALCAETMNATEMAAGFWEAAFASETGRHETFDPTPPPLTSPSSTETQSLFNLEPPKAEPSAPAHSASSPHTKEISHLPPHLQPGRILTMQPCDTLKPQSYFIESPDHIGQPKRDGHRNVLIASESGVFHQSRSTQLLSNLHPDLQTAIGLAAQRIGTFVLDGERYYLSVTGAEHRTSAQAATANIKAGKGEIPPIEVFSVFKALYAHGCDLTPLTEFARIDAAKVIVELIDTLLFDNSPNRPRIEVVPTAYTTQEKRALAQIQFSEGREGEVWIVKNAPYTPGKNHKTDIIRTKYKSESIVRVHGLTPSTNGRSFGSILICDENGNDLGAIGTGFDQNQSETLAQTFANNPRNTKIKIRHAGHTETGKVWQGVFLDIE